MRRGLILVFLAALLSWPAVAAPGLTVSPAVARLSATPASERAAALDRFWAERKAAGGPLVEPLGKGRSRITFLYRDKPGIEGVRLDAPMGALLVAPGEDPDKAGSLTRVANTDIWALTVTVSDRLRTAYTFLIDRPGQARPKRSGDALNPKTFAEDYPGGGSLLELSAAPPQPWRDAKAPAGRWAKLAMPGQAGQPEKTVWVHLPAGYDPASPKTYPLLIAQQSIPFGLAMPTGRMADTLAAEGRIPPIIIATTEFATGEDVAQLDRFAAHVADDLLPWLRAQFHVASDRRRVAIAGTSRRGLSAAYVGLTRPDAVGGVLSLSGAFYWKPEGERDFEWIVRRFAASDRKPVRFFLAAGELETVATARNGGLAPLRTTRDLYGVLSRKGYAVRRMEFYGGHGEVNWQDALDDGLIWLFGRP